MSKNLADDCNDIADGCDNRDSDIFDGTMEAVDLPSVRSDVSGSDELNDAESAVTEIDTPKSADILDFYRNQPNRSTSNPPAEEMNILNEFAQTIDELETSLSEGRPISDKTLMNSILLVGQAWMKNRRFSPSSLTN